jgi:hypothetical protein
MLEQKEGKRRKKARHDIYGGHGKQACLRGRKSVISGGLLSPRP